MVADRFSTEENVETIHREILDITDTGANVIVKTDQESLTCSKVFNSIFRADAIAAQTKYPLLKQHFIGWRVKTNEPVFNPKQPTFMDFSVEQKGNTRFMYVLPFSATEALVEYTLFSKDLLPDDQYETSIKQYLEKLGVSQHEVLETERGNIPMTAYKFWQHNTKNIIHIGSAGGWTKASTGYTFKNAMKKSSALVKFIEREADFRKFHHPNRFWFYDLLLLDILAEKNELGSSVFASMFRYGNPATILKFLDEETSLTEDLQVISKCPKKLFLSALSRRLFK